MSADVVLISRIGEVRTILGSGFKHLIAGLRGLLTHQASVWAIACDQDVVGTLLHYLTVFQHQYSVGCDDARQSMCEGQRRTSSHHPIEGILNERLVFGINC